MHRFRSRFSESGIQAFAESGSIPDPDIEKDIFFKKYQLTKTFVQKTPNISIDLPENEASSPTESSSNRKFLIFPLFGD
jgi:hypothetical protein